MSWIPNLKNQKEDGGKNKDQGILLISGLIAGEGWMGVVNTVIAVILTRTSRLF